MLTGEFPGFGGMRRRFRRVPSDPRCKLCSAPFGGIGGKAFAALGYGRSSNPELCQKCTIVLRKSGLAGVRAVGNDGLVDKLVGDEVIGLFFGGVSGPDHAGVAIRAALELAVKADRPDATPMGPIPLGTAVHTVVAFVGAAGLNAPVVDFTGLGDAVNVIARLASAAAAGEVLVSVAAAREARVFSDSRECRTLPLLGRREPIEVVVLRALTRSMARCVG